MGARAAGSLPHNYPIKKFVGAWFFLKQVISGYESSKGPVLSLVLVSFVSFSTARAALVTSWTLTGNGDLSDQATSSPIVGDGTDGSASNKNLLGNFSDVSLGDGHRITLTGNVIFTGISDGANTNDQFRFGLFKDNRSGSGDPWTGYRSSNETSSASASLSTASNTSTSPTAFSGSTALTGLSTGFGELVDDTSYAFSLSLERSGDNLSIESSLLGGGQDFGSASYDHISATEGFDYDTVGLLVGINLNADQVSFSNIDVNVVPEPASYGLLLGLASLIGMAVRRPQRPVN